MKTINNCDACNLKTEVRTCYGESLCQKCINTTQKDRKQNPGLTEKEYQLRLRKLVPFHGIPPEDIYEPTE